MSSLNKVKIVYIAPECMLDLFRKRSTDEFIETCECINLPEDFKVIACCYDFDRNMFGVKISSDEFEEVQTGNVIPEFRLVIQTNRFMLKDICQLDSP